MCEFFARCAEVASGLGAWKNRASFLAQRTPYFTLQVEYLCKMLGFPNVDTQNGWHLCCFLWRKKWPIRNIKFVFYSWFVVVFLFGCGFVSPLFH
jgi:hypothetical protein